LFKREINHFCTVICPFISVFVNFFFHAFNEKKIVYGSSLIENDYTNFLDGSSSVYTLQNDQCISLKQSYQTDP